MSESHFSKRMRDKLFPLGVQCYRIESSRTQAGIPDIHYLCKNGVAGWIETKQVDQPPSRIKYEPQQALWLDNYARAGGRCCTIAHIESLDSILFIPGRFSLSAERIIAPGQFASCLVELRRKDAWLQLRSLLADS